LRAQTPTAAQATVPSTGLPHYIAARAVRSRRLPTLIRFVIVVGVLAALVYGGLFYLATEVKIPPHEITQTIELPKAPK
jgi:hypothetical protein